MTAARPWHVPVVGWLAVVWTALGALDFTLMQLRVEPYLGAFTTERVAFFSSLPDWIDALWGIGVWAGLAGALFLAVDIRRSAAILGLSALAIVLAGIYLVFISSPTLQEAVGEEAFWILAVAVVVAILLWIYARWLHSAGAVS